MQQERAPGLGRTIQNTFVTKKFGEITTDIRSGGGIGRTQVDEQDGA